MDAAEFRAMVDGGLDQGGPYPTLDDYSAALTLLRNPPLFSTRFRMAKVKSDPKVLDPCPHCQGVFKYIHPPTPEQRAAAASRDNPAPLSPLVDTASEAQLAELGALYRCVDCGYATRLTPARAGATVGTTGN